VCQCTLIHVASVGCNTGICLYASAPSVLKSHSHTHANTHMHTHRNSTRTHTCRTHLALFFWKACPYEAHLLPRLYPRILAHSHHHRPQKSHDTWRPLQTFWPAYMYICISSVCVCAGVCVFVCVHVYPLYACMCVYMCLCMRMSVLKY